MCTHYIIEKCNMLIFAHAGVMKNSKDKLIFFHITLILGQILFFSSKIIKKRRDTPTRNKRPNDERKEFLALNIRTSHHRFMRPIKTYAL